LISTEKLLEVAKEAAYAAGEIQLSFFGKKKEISHKANEFDLVTNADKLSEEKIMSIIQANFPDHDILGEESGKHFGEHKSEYLWVIDPLDGTTNFAHNFPHFAVSIGLVKNGKIIMGVVYDVCKNELFWAAEGTGAYLNSDPIEISKIGELKKSLLATGFPCIRETTLEENFVYFKEFIYKAQAVRRPGSAALDLCYVAAGRLDGFWELNLAPWDVTAGACIVREAGGKVTNFDSEDFNPEIKDIIASNTFIHEFIKEIIFECRKKMGKT
jgi:myo-inositol-1(or 4)-monophosphatase